MSIILKIGWPIRYHKKSWGPPSIHRSQFDILCSRTPIDRCKVCNAEGVWRFLYFIRLLENVIWPKTSQETSDVWGHPVYVEVQPSSHLGPLEIKKNSLKKVNVFDQNHTARIWQIQDNIPFLSDPEVHFLNLCAKP